MAIIDAEGLFKGERLQKCSDLARYCWPYLFLASNGYGRLELDYHNIAERAFAGFKEPLSEDEFCRIMREYRDARLLFVYQAGDALWGQWDATKGSLPRFKTRRDEDSPKPPAIEMESFFAEYRSGKHNPKTSENLRKILEGFGEVPKAFAGEESSGEEKVTAANLSNLDMNKTTPPDVQEDMSKIRNDFNDLCLEILGSKAEPEAFKETWDDMKSLVRVFGKAAVLEAFSDWSRTQAGQVIKYPVSDFGKVATGLLNGTSSLKADPRLKTLVIDLTAASDGTVLFDNGRQVELGQLLKDYEPEEVLLAFRTYYERLTDDRDLRFAAKTFCQTASALIETRRRSLRLQQETQQQIADLGAQRDQQVAQEAAKASAKGVEETVEFDPLKD